MKNHILLLFCVSIVFTVARSASVDRDDKKTIKSKPQCQSTVPNFSKQGRRISEAKCMVYKWEAEQRQDCDANVGSELKEDEITEFPHLSTLGWKTVDGSWEFKCGGCLISDRFVLTAGHCARVRHTDQSLVDPAPKIVRLGDKNILDQGKDGKKPTDAIIKRIIIHPEYKAPKKNNDIALLELETPVKFSRLIHPACLWVNEDTSILGNKGSLAGWGQVESGNNKISPVIKKASFDIVNNDICDSVLNPYHNRLWDGVRDSHICAKPAKGNDDITWGNSGSPLLVKTPLKYDSGEVMYYVIGVTSFGIGKNPDIPGVYTRVSKYIDWIEKTIWSS